MMVTPDARAPRRTYAYEDLPELLELPPGDVKHAAASHSTLDVQWVLYDRVLSVSPDRLDDPDRDRFLLSKGHGAKSIYAVLAAKGFIAPEELPDWASFGSRLGGHPDTVLIPGVEMSSGSLGHGLPIAIGLAIGLAVQGRERPRVFCLIGDGEFDEGSNHEAVVLAAGLSLGRLTAIVVDNRSSTYGWPGGIAERFAVAGWSASTVDGHDHDALATALVAGDGTRPHVVVAEVGG